MRRRMISHPRRHDGVVLTRTRSLVSWHLWLASFLLFLAADLPSSVALRRRSFLPSFPQRLGRNAFIGITGAEGSRTIGSVDGAASAAATRISLDSCVEISTLSVRGGDSSSLTDDEEEENDDEEEEELLDDLEDVFDEFELGDEADEDDFAEQSVLDRAIDAYHKTPPLTKGYLTASAIITGLGWAMNRNQFPEILLLDWKQTLTKGQFWRPLTTFFNFGPLGLGYFLTIHFVWTYMSTLERLHHRKPYEFWIMISFGMMSMVFGYPILKLNARFLGHNLSTFLVYMWSRYHEGLQVKMFEVHTTRAELLPWYFLLQVSGCDVVTFSSVSRIYTRGRFQERPHNIILLLSPFYFMIL
jgi:Der1-like family